MMNMKKKYTELRQRGLTLIEAAMVLAIATLVVAGIMIFFQSASIGSKTNEAMSQLGDLQNGVRSIYAGQPTYVGLNNAGLIAARIIPSKMVSGAEIRHAFNGNVTVAPATYPTGGSANNSFTVTYANVPAEACIKMGIFDLGTGMVKLDISGGTAATIIDNAAAGTNNRTPAAVGAACGTGNSTLVWTFY